MEGRNNFIRFWDAMTEPDPEQEAGPSTPVTAPAETRGSLSTQQLSLSGNFSSAESKGSSDPIASDLAGSSESMEVVRLWSCH